MTRPTVSVVIPVRDGAEFLGECIESVLGQTVPADEIVVVDDGSTDASAAIADAYPGVTVLKGETVGPAGARNRGVRSSHSELVAFHDADDVMDVERLARQTALLVGDSGLAGVFGAAQPFTIAKGERIEEPVVMAPLLGTLLVRRRAFLDSGGFDAAIVAGELGEWLVRVRHAGLRFTTLQEVVVERRRHDSNITRDSDRLRAGYLAMARASIAHHRSNRPS